MDLLCCPALVEEQIYLKQVINSRLSYWNIPYSTLPFMSANTDSGASGNLQHVRALPLKMYLPLAWIFSQTHSGRLIKPNHLSLLGIFSKAYRKSWTTARYHLSPTSYLAQIYLVY